jgi:hypothetical protein
VDKDKEGKVVAAVRPIKEGVWLGKDWVVLEGLERR